MPATEFTFSSHFVCGIWICNFGFAIFIIWYFVFGARDCNGWRLLCGFSIISFVKRCFIFSSKRDNAEEIKWIWQTLIPRNEWMRFWRFKVSSLKWYMEFVGFWSKILRFIHALCIEEAFLHKVLRRIPLKKILKKRLFKNLFGLNPSKPPKKRIKTICWDTGNSQRKKQK